MVEKRSNITDWPSLDRMFPRYDDMPVNERIGLVRGALKAMIDSIEDDDIIDDLFEAFFGLEENYAEMSDLWTRRVMEIVREKLAALGVTMDDEVFFANKEFRTMAEVAIDISIGDFDFERCFGSWREDKVSDERALELMEIIYNQVRDGDRDPIVLMNAFAELNSRKTPEREITLILEDLELERVMGEVIMLQGKGEA